MLETVGDISRQQVWTKYDRFCDLGRGAGVGMAYEYSGDTVVVFRWVGPGEPACTSMILEFSLMLFCLSKLTGLDARLGCGREVVELQTKTNAEDWPVAGPRTLSWCARFLNWQ